MNQGRRDDQDHSAGGAPGGDAGVDIQAEAALLLRAYRSGPLPPLTDRHPDLQVDQAYAIQQAQIEQRIQAGASVVGFKVGLTSVAMQRQFGVDRPDFGRLLSDMRHTPTVPIDVSRYLQPRAEPEFALVLGRDLVSPGIRTEDLLEATDWVVPAIEIIDSRIANWQITLPDTVADNASSGGFVLGEDRVRPHELDLRHVSCTFSRNGAVEHVGTGADVLGSPFDAAVWLANTLLDRDVALPRGSVILTGSVTAAVSVSAGDELRVDLAGIGTVTAQFVSSNTGSRRC